MEFQGAPTTEEELQRRIKNFYALKRMTTTHRCSICHAPLVLPWDKEANDYRLVCGQHREHTGYERRPTMAQECQERERQMEWAKPLADMDAEEIEDLFR